jgi:ankyrin repeat protein
LFFSCHSHLTAIIVAAGALHRDDESRQPESKYFAATELCFSLGLDVNAKNQDGVTPMHGAAIAGVDSVVQYLFDHGAELNPRTETGQMPLVYALRYEIAMTTFDHPSTAALLRKLGAKE